MMISTKGRYALRVLVDMAEHQTEGYIPIKETDEAACVAWLMRLYQEKVGAQG